MPKRITLDKEEEIELTERENEIYKAGINEGFSQGGCLVFIIIVIILSVIAIAT